MGKSILIKEEERIEKEFKRLSKFNLREFIVKLDNKIIENFFHKVTRESNPFFRLESMKSQFVTAKRKLALVNFCLRDLVQNVEAVQEGLVDFQKYQRIRNEQSELTKFEIIYQQDSIPFQITISLFNTKNSYKTLSEMKLEVFRTLTYYRSVNQKFQQKAPSFYHSRFYPFDLMSRGISASTPEFNLSSILIEVEEWMGEDFTSSIVTQIVDFEFFKYELLKSKASVLRGKDNSNNVTPTLTQRSRIRMGDTEKSDLVKESLTSQEKIELNKQRGSLVSFMWGALLATYCKKLEKIPVNLVVTNLDQRYFPEFISHINSEGREELRQDIPGMIEQFNSEKYMDDEYTHYTNTIAYIAENIDYLKDQSFPFPAAQLQKTLDDIIINFVYSVFRDPQHMRLLPDSIEPKNLKIFNKNSNLLLTQHYKDVWTQDYQFRGFNIDPEYGGILGNKLYGYANSKMTSAAQSQIDDRKATNLGSQNLGPTLNHSIRTGLGSVQSYQENSVSNDNDQTKATENLDFGFVGTRGHILGKYRLKAEMEFLFEEMKIDIAGSKYEHDPEEIQTNENQSLMNKIPEKNAQKDDADWIAEGMLEGFLKHWEIDEEDQILLVQATSAED